MAAPIALRTTVAATPGKIFHVLSQSEGLASFWTTDSQAEQEVGSIATFGFPTGSKLEVRVDELDYGRRVVWTPLNDLLTGPRWKGTSVTWDLRETDAGSTDVLFQHANWPNHMSQADVAGTAYLWAQIVRALKSYSETGIPQPFFAMAPPAHQQR